MRPRAVLYIVHYAVRFGHRARDPHIAGLLVGAAALLFTLVWVLAALVTVDIGGTVVEEATFVVFFLVVTPPNAYAVTRLAWHWLIAPRQQLTYRRAALVGVGAGLTSYATLSAAFFLAFVGIRWFQGEAINGFVGEPVSLVTLPLDVLVYAFVGSLFGIYLTAEIPIILTVGVALGLVHLHQSLDDPETVA